MKGTMKITLKRIVSVLLALAMVVTSLNYSPKEVKADEGYTITSPQNNISVEYKIITNNMTGLYENGFMDDQGRRFIITYNAQYTSENTKITVDDVEVQKTSNYEGWIFDQFAGGVHFLTNNMPTNRYASIKFFNKDDNDAIN